MSKRKSYYNTHLFTTAHNIMDYDPEESFTQITSYIKKYPRDYVARLDYINLLISFEKTSEAEKAIEEVSSMVARDHHFKNLDKRYHIFIRNFKFMKAKLLACLERYEELYDFCEKNYEQLNSVDSLQLYYLMIYCKKKMGKQIDDFAYDRGNYMYKQIKDYKDSEFLKNMKRYLLSEGGNPESTGGRVFSEDFPFEKVLEETKKHISEILDESKTNKNVKFFVGLYSDSYVFKLDCCGWDKNHMVDYFKVDCFHNTTIPIVIYPVYGYENRNYIDLNYLRKQNPKIKRPQKSQVQKFYDRYHKKN